MKERYFVVGGSGFLGKNSILALLNSGYDIVALRRRRSLDAVSSKRLVIIDGSLLDPVVVLARMMEGCTAILYMAGSTTPASSADSPGLDVQENLLPFLNVLDAANLANISRIVFLSSGGTVYGKPQTVPISELHSTLPSCSYGAVKLAAEHLLRLWAERSGSKWIVLRVANPYGPHQECHGAQGVVAAWLDKAMAGKSLQVWGDGRIVRDYVYVDDVSSAIVKAVSLDSLDSGIYNIGSGRGATLLDIAAAIESALGRQIILEFGAGRTCDVPVNVLDSSRFMKLADWTPLVGLDEGVARTAAWLNLKK